MNVVVNDANILIDLVKLNMLPHFFGLEMAFHTTNLIIEELYESQQQELHPYIDNGKLIVSELPPEQQVEIFKLSTVKKTLSPQDISAFIQAKSMKATLVTSDNNLRRYAKEQQLDVHGHLWVFDQMINAQTITPQRASQKLDQLCQEINPRLNLPVEECNKRKKKWSKGS